MEHACAPGVPSVQTSSNDTAIQPMTRNPDQYRLGDAEHQAIFEQDIVPDLFAETKATTQPLAVIFGGQPGAGKSAAIDGIANELESQGGAVFIIGDDLRDYHPKYAQLMESDDKTAAFYTDRDAGLWIEKSIAEAKERRVNIVIEGTMRDSHKIATTMKSLRDAGYRIDARALAVNSLLSEQGILQRYENQKVDRGAGRMTTPEAHKAAYDGMLKTLERIEFEKLADRVTIYRRGADTIYFNELHDGQWKQPPQASSVVEKERSRPMTLQERRDYARGCDELASMVARPERGASTQEKRNIASLQQQAQWALAAEVFRQEPAEQAIRQHPELADACGEIRTRAAQAKAEGLNDQECSTLIAHAREALAIQIERGEGPGLVQSTHASDRHPVNLSALQSGGRYAYRQAIAPSSAPGWSAEQERRATGLEAVRRTAVGASLTFAELGCEAIHKAGNAAKVDWRRVEDAAMAQSLQNDRQPASQVYQAIAAASPAAVTESQKSALRDRVDRLAPGLEAGHRPAADAGPSPAG